jgi:hypothetical protein
MNRNKKTKNVKVNKAIENIQNIQMTYDIDTANNNKTQNNSLK